ncbi:MAG: YebC/PmpR family DNA-binding transcriptional regulator [bacterium]|nr:YebC/PmpR family DNA-binding transcriptional regulator [bacterium]
MSGHSKWSQIKHQKGITDKKKAVVFSRHLRAIAAAAVTEPNPDFNPRLRSAIESAKADNVPNDNIARAVAKAGEEKPMEELVIEAYGPEGVALIIDALTDSHNRTIAEIKHLLALHEGKMGAMGSVQWAFEPPQYGAERIAKFPQAISDENVEKLSVLVDALEEHRDVQRVSTNAE